MLNNKYTEIIKLATMLVKAGIPFSVNYLFNGIQIVYPNDKDVNRICSAIEHDGSYGHEQNLIEIMGLLTPEEENYDSVKGFLTANEVFNRINNHYNYYKEI